MYTNRACSFHVNKRTAALGDSLLAKAVLCHVSIVRPILISLCTNHVRKEMSILWLPTTFLVNRFVSFLLDCTFGKN